MKTPEQALRALGIFFQIGTKHPDSKRTRKQEMSERRQARKDKRTRVEWVNTQGVGI
jgi:hypothetical protein